MSEAAMAVQKMLVAKLRDPGQAELFLDEDVAGTPLLFALAEGRQPDQARFTGAIVEKQRERVARVIELSRRGLSQRDIEAAVGMGRHTIKGIQTRAEKRGELAPLKERLAARLLTLAERCVGYFEVALDEGLVKPEAASIAAGIFTDKAVALQGGAALTIDVRVSEVPTEAAILELCRRARAAQTIDVVSSVSGVESEESEGFRQVGPGVGPTDGVISGGKSADQAEGEGGGGVAVLPGAGEAEGNRRDNFEPKAFS